MGVCVWVREFICVCVCESVCVCLDLKTVFIIWALPLAIYHREPPRAVGTGSRSHICGCVFESANSLCVCVCVCCCVSSRYTVSAALCVCV